MAHMVKAQALVVDDRIDLDEIDQELGHDLEEPNARVEYVSIEGENVRIVTDAGAVEVPLGFGVWVFGGSFGQ